VKFNRVKLAVSNNLKKYTNGSRGLNRARVKGHRGGLGVKGEMREKQKASLLGACTGDTHKKTEKTEDLYG